NAAVSLCGGGQAKLKATPPTRSRSACSPTSPPRSTRFSAHRAAEPCIARRSEMSMAEVMCDRFADELNTLIEQANGTIDGLSVGDILLRAAVRELIGCVGGGRDGFGALDARDQAVVELTFRAVGQIWRAME